MYEFASKGLLKWDYWGGLGGGASGVLIFEAILGSNPANDLCPKVPR